MAARLILPINRARLTASWKTAAYRQRFGFEHYGIDMVSAAGDTLVYASGEGTVLAAGRDSVLGNCLVVRYRDALNRESEQERDVICRMFHFDRLLVGKNAKLTKDTPIGRYGNTGMYSIGAHLHLEMDTDLAYPFHTPTLLGKSTLFSGKRQGATDAAMSDPLEWLYCKTSAPDRQTYTTAGDRYIRQQDRTLPCLA